jgi:hypothetical protein
MAFEELCAVEAAVAAAVAAAIADGEDFTAADFTAEDFAAEDFAAEDFGSIPATGLATGFASTFGAGFAGAFGSGFFAAAFSAADPASFCVTLPTLIVPRGSIFGSRDGVRAETTLSSGLSDDFEPLPELACAPPTTDLRPFESDADEPETLRLPRADESLAIDHRG